MGPRAGMDMYGKSRLPPGFDSRTFQAVASRCPDYAVLAPIKIKMHKTTNLTVVLYGCETWSVALKEEHRLTVFENRAPRKIFGPQKDGITRDWRRLHNEELCCLYSSSDIIRVSKTKE